MGYCEKWIYILLIPFQMEFKMLSRSALRALSTIPCRRFPAKAFVPLKLVAAAPQISQKR